MSRKSEIEVEFSFLAIRVREDALTPIGRSLKEKKYLTTHDISASIICHFSLKSVALKPSEILM